MSRYHRFFRGVIGLDFVPRLATVGGVQQGALLDADVHDVGVARIDRHALGVRDVGWAWEGPPLCIRDVVDGRELLPAPPVILAFEQRHWLRACQNGAADGAQRKHVLDRQSVCAALPRVAVVGAVVQAAVVDTGEDAVATGFGDQCAWMQITQGSRDNLPGGARLVALHDGHTARGRHQQSGGRGIGPMDVHAVGREADGHSAIVPPEGSAEGRLRGARGARACPPWGPSGKKCC